MLTIKKYRIFPLVFETRHDYFLVLLLLLFDSTSRSGTGDAKQGSTENPVHSVPGG